VFRLGSESGDFRIIHDTPATRTNHCGSGEIATVATVWLKLKG